MHDMHPTFARLLEAGAKIKHLDSQTKIARLLNISDQVITNWKSRGVPEKMFIKVSRAIGCHPFWLEDGHGDMVFGNANYGYDKMTPALCVNEPSIHAISSPPADERIILQGYRDADPPVRDAMLYMAREASKKMDFSPRSETQ